MNNQRFIIVYQCAILTGLITFSSEHCNIVRKYTYVCNRNYYKCLTYKWEGTNIWECNQLHNLNSFTHNRNYRSLEIFDSYLDDMEVGSFQGFDYIDGLTISNSSIHNLELGVFNGLSKLSFLNLTRNHIGFISRGVLNSMFGLYILDLSENSIEYIDNKTFTGMNVLERLYLNQNHISDMPILTKCINLKVLDISNNKIDKLDFLVDCLMIENLNVAGNAIQYFDKDNLKNLSKLRRLNLSQNSLFNGTDMPLDLFQNVALLETLNLSCTSIKKLSVGSFSGLEKLEILDLSFNGLTSLPKGVFHDLLSLRNLYINNNHLSSFEYDGFSNLNIINLDGNSWNCGELSVITKSLTKIKIVRGTTNNTTNVFGIACSEETKDSQNIAEYNSSNVNNLGTEYLTYIIKTEKYMIEAFTELRNFLNQTVSNRNDQNENKLIEALTDFKHFLNETNFYQKNYSENYWKGLEEYSLQYLKYNVEDITKKIENTITAIQNRTYLEKDAHIALQTDIKQMIGDLKNAIIQKDLEERNYAIDHLEKQSSAQNAILMDIKNILTSSKSISEPLISEAKSLKKLKTPDITYESQSGTAALYCILVILCAILVLLLSKRLRKNKISPNSNIECNSLSPLNV